MTENKTPIEDPRPYLLYWLTDNDPTVDGEFDAELTVALEEGCREARKIIHSDPPDSDYWDAQRGGLDAYGEYDSHAAISYHADCEAIADREHHARCQCVKSYLEPVIAKYLEKKSLKAALWQQYLSLVR